VDSIRGLQSHFFDLGLKHLDLNPEAELHDEMWKVWASNQPNRATIRKPQNVRGGEKLSWTELSHVINRFPSCIEVVCNESSEEHGEKAEVARRLLYQLHRIWLKVTKCVKQLSYDGSRTPVLISVWLDLILV
jgi:hypothetical protein